MTALFSGKSCGKEPAGKRPQAQRGFLCGRFSESRGDPLGRARGPRENPKGGPRACIVGGDCRKGPRGEAPYWEEIFEKLSGRGLEEGPFELLKGRRAEGAALRKRCCGAEGANLQLFCLRCV